MRRLPRPPESRSRLGRGPYCCARPESANLRAWSAGESNPASLPVKSYPGTIRAPSPRRPPSPERANELGWVAAFLSSRVGWWRTRLPRALGPPHVGPPWSRSRTYRRAKCAVKWMYCEKRISIQNLLPFPLTIRAARTKPSACADSARIGGSYEW